MKRGGRLWRDGTLWNPSKCWSGWRKARQGARQGGLCETAENFYASSSRTVSAHFPTPWSSVLKPVRIWSGFRLPCFRFRAWNGSTISSCETFMESKQVQEWIAQGELRAWCENLL